MDIYTFTILYKYEKYFLFFSSIFYLCISKSNRDAQIIEKSIYVFKYMYICILNININYELSISIKKEKQSIILQFVCNIEIYQSLIS